VNEVIVRRGFEREHVETCAMTKAARGGGNPYDFACTCDAARCDECDPSFGCFDGSVQCIRTVKQQKPVKDADDAAKIASWLRAGAGEKRGLDTIAFQEAVMPILRDLADRIERGEWKGSLSKKTSPVREILGRAHDVLAKTDPEQRSIRHDNVMFEIEEFLGRGGTE